MWGRAKRGINTSVIVMDMILLMKGIFIMFTNCICVYVWIENSNFMCNLELNIASYIVYGIEIKWYQI